MLQTPRLMHAGTELMTAVLHSQNKYQMPLLLYLLGFR